MPILDMTLITPLAAAFDVVLAGRVVVDAGQQALRDHVVEGLDTPGRG
jgi:hypothetical protein